MRYLKDSFLLFLLLLFAIIALCFPFFIAWGITVLWSILSLIGKILVILLGIYLIILEFVLLANLDEVCDEMGLELNDEEK